MTRAAVRLFAAAVACFAAPALAGDRAQNPPEQRVWDRTSEAVHEWGTFTTVQGSDGVVLDGLSHEERGLPEFVYDLRDYAGVFARSPKMETPVIYFYSPKERYVSVDVDFPRGVVTQWYPGAMDVNGMGFDKSRRWLPPNGELISDLTQGRIRWRRMRVLAPDAPAPLLPVSADDPWRFSRRVDANTLRVCNWSYGFKGKLGRDRSNEPLLEYEKCLFYRGLGAFPLPLTAKVADEQATRDWYSVRLDLVNADPDPLTHLFVIWVQDGRAGYHRIDRLEGSSKEAFSLQLDPVADVTERLVRELSAALTETGLFSKESLAMARTWQEGYFQDAGLRILYVLPRAFIDRELPLKVRGMSKDCELVRTFVGRAELLSPTREAAMARAVTAWSTGPVAGRAAARTRLTSWGRFAAPYLNRVIALSRDPTVQASAREALRTLELRR